MEYITRADAINAGLKRFFLGQECPRGHIAERFISDGSCMICRRERIRERRKDPLVRKKETEVEMKKRSDNPEYHEKRKATGRRCSKRKREDPDYVENLKIKQNDWRKNKGGTDWVNKYVREKTKNDPAFAMASRLRGRLKDMVKRNGFRKEAKTVDLIGCTYEFFVKHIERQFLPGMSWENKNLWHIDHIIPLSSAKDEKDMISLMNFTNLRPLWAKDNLKKNSKILTLL